MRGKIFVAGAFGAIGMRLIPILIKDGWQVLGMTRSRERAEAMTSLGLHTVVANAFNSDSVEAALTAYAPDVLMHQLTDLPRELAMLDGAALERNARLRQLGTRNLVGAAERSKVTHIVAQSIAFDYAPGPKPYREDSVLAGRLPGASATSDGVVSLEDQVLASAIPSTILRYGRLYGPGTGSDRAWGPAGIHVDAAAHAAVLSVRSKVTGTFNIAEDDGEVDSNLARKRLGWNDEWRFEQHGSVAESKLGVIE